MRKKYTGLSCLMVCAMALSGCQAPEGSETADYTESSGGTQTSENTESSGSEQASESTAANESGYDVEALRQEYPDKTVLTWVYNDMITLTEAQQQQINERLIELEADCLIDFVQIQSGDYEGRVNAMIEKETAPDIICGGLQNDMGGTYVGLSNDWFLPLDDYLTDTEAGRKLWASMPEKFWETLKFSGHYYGVATYLSVSHSAYYVNKELMEKYDITREMLEDQPLNELQDILQMVKDGEGEACTALTMVWNTPTYGFNTRYRVMMEPYAHYSDALVLKLGGDPAEIVNLYETQEAAGWFHMMASYREAGFFEGEDTYFLAVGASDHFSNYAEDVKKNYENNFGSVSNIEVIEFAANELMPQTANLNGVCAQSAHPEEAVETFCICMSDQVISDLFIYGVEGQDYERMDGYVNQEARSMWNILCFGNVFAASKLLSEKDQPDDYWEETVNEMYAPAMSGVILDMRDCKEQITAIQSVVNAYSGLNTGSYENVDEVLAGINEKLYEAGIEEVLQEANRQMKEALE